jgi:hypothetical protein
MKQEVRWGRRGVAGLAALVLLTRCGPGTLESEPGEKPECRASGLGELALGPEADVYVEQDQGGAVVGAARKLVADNLSRRSAFLRFQVPEVPGPVRQATLRLYALDGSTDGPKLYSTTVEWNEDDLTWDQAPAVMGAPLGDAGHVPNGSWVEYDVTALVTQGGSYGFALVTESRNGVDFASKEHARKELAPRLVLTVDVATTSDCDPQP